MVVTSLLAFTVFRRAWGWPLAAVLAVLVPLLAIEVVFLGANLAKLHDGGYVPLIIAGDRRPADDDLGARHARSSTPRRTPPSVSLDALIGDAEEVATRRAPPAPRSS